VGCIRVRKSFEYEIDTSKVKKQFARIKSMLNRIANKIVIASMQLSTINQLNRIVFETYFLILVDNRESLKSFKMKLKDKSPIIYFQNNTGNAFQSLTNVNNDAYYQIWVLVYDQINS